MTQLLDANGIHGHSSFACGSAGGRGKSYSVDVSEEEVVEVNYSTYWHSNTNGAGKFEQQFVMSLGRSQDFAVSDGYAARATFRTPKK